MRGTNDPQEMSPDMFRWLGPVSVIALTVVIGSLLQLLFWKSADRTVAEALVHNYGLWIIYLVVSAIVMEHSFRFLNKRSKKPRD